MTATATLYSLPKHTLADIPDALRRIADSMEAGEYGDLVAVPALISGFTVQVRTTIARTQCFRALPRRSF